MRAAKAQAVSKIAKSKSEDLSRTVKFDEGEGGGYYDEDDDGEDERAMFEKLEQQAKARNSSLWDDPSHKLEKGKVLQTLVLNFSMIVQKEEADDEDDDEDEGNITMETTYTKLPSALKSIKKILE